VSSALAGPAATAPPVSLLVLTTTLPREAGDGTPEFVLALAGEMSRTFRVLVLAPRVRGAPLRQEIGDVEIRRFPYFFRRWEGLADEAILPNLRAAPWRVIEVPFLVTAMFIYGLVYTLTRRPTLLHAHWIVPAGLVALGIRILTRRPYVLTVHGADVYGINHPLYIWLRNRIVAAAAAVLPVSRHLAGILGLPRSKPISLVVPMGVDMHDISPSVQLGERAAEQFLFVGRLAEKKGVDVLLRACALVPAARLVVVGKGPEEERLKRLTLELGIDARVEFAGQLPRRQVLSALRNAAALVIPSRVASDGDQEGTPVVLAEGIAMSAPIIASAVGGLAERIQHNVTGLLVNPGCVESLRAALQYAIDHPHQVSTLAECAHSTLLADLDMKTSAAQYREVICALIETGRHS
jgi:colanic acid/amylovoran biosynthesis glycosyltransferase